MPKLTRCVLANTDHKLPMPDRGMRLFRVKGETVDIEDPFWLGLINDGSIKRAPKSVGKRKGSQKPAPGNSDATTDSGKS